MPEIAAIGLMGAIVTFLVVNWNLFSVHRSFQKESLQTLNHNLSKVQKYWSLEQGRVVEVAEWESQTAYQKRDYEKSTRAAFLFGTMMIFLSWAGLVLFLIYFISTNKLAKSRMEERIFSSELVKNKNLPQNQVSSLLQEMESLG